MAFVRLYFACMPFAEKKFRTDVEDGRVGATLIPFASNWGVTDEITITRDLDDVRVV